MPVSPTDPDTMQNADFMPPLIREEAVADGRWDQFGFFLLCDPPCPLR